MPPSRPADGCLFCAPDPCTCNTKKVKPARAARKTVPPVVTPEIATPRSVTPPPVVEQSAAAQPRRSGLRAVKSIAPQIQRPTVAKAVQQDAEREDEMTSAIRLFAEAGLIDADELKRHRADLRMTDHDFGELLSKVGGT